jgi:hypothetical protein
MNLEQFGFEGDVGQVVGELQVAQKLGLGFLGRATGGVDAHAKHKRNVLE